MDASSVLANSFGGVTSGAEPQIPVTAFGAQAMLNRVAVWVRNLDMTLSRPSVEPNLRARWTFFRDSFYSYYHGNIQTLNDANARQVFEGARHFDSQLESWRKEADRQGSPPPTVLAVGVVVVALAAGFFLLKGKAL